MTTQEAEEFAGHWIDAWNSHDIGRIMACYEDDIEFYSPMIVQLGFDSVGRIGNKADLHRYFEIGLAAYPDLNFVLLHVLSGVDSLVIHYRSVNNKLAAEVMEVNAAGKVVGVKCHYGQQL